MLPGTSGASRMRSSIAGDARFVLNEIRTGALAGTMSAAAGRAFPPPPPPPQPAATIATVASRDAAPARTGLLDLEERVEGGSVPRAAAPREERAQRLQVLRRLLWQRGAGEAGDALDQRDRVLQVDVVEAGVRGRHPGRRLRFLEASGVRELRAGAGVRAHAVEAAREQD